MLHITEVNNRKQFYEMKNSWDMTLEKSVDNNIFLTWEKMAPSVDQLLKENSLRILCATEGNELIGIAPFRRAARNLLGPIRYHFLEFLTNGETDYTGLILTRKVEQCLDQFLTHLLKQKDWDFMYFPDLPQSSKTLELLKRAKNIPSFEIERGHICPYIALPNSREKLLASLNPKFTRKLRKSLQRLELEQGKVELKQYYELCSLEQAIEILARLHQKRWANKGQPGRFSNQKALAITKQTARYFAEKDWLRLYFLTVENRVVAVELNLEYGGTMYCHLKGFDPDYSKYSVGNLLTLKVLKECIDRKISEYDFMQGDEAYKFRWTSKYRRNTDVKWVNKSFSSRLINVCLKVARRAKICSILSKFISILHQFGAIR